MRKNGEDQTIDASTLEDVANKVRESFPFEDYLGSMRSHTLISRIVGRYAEEGARILDFGSGPCDKSAMLALCNYQVYACDDLLDQWHLQNRNREKIRIFARDIGIDFFQIEEHGKYPYQEEQFDLIMMNHVLEHLHESPYQLLTQIVQWLKPRGFLIITVPNAANLRKRLHLLVGRTNYPPFPSFFWYPGQWRGHVREYVLNDLRLLADFMNLSILELRGVHQMADEALKNHRELTRYMYFAITSPFPQTRDSLLLMAQKPLDWDPSLLEDNRPSNEALIGVSN